MPLAASDPSCYCPYRFADVAQLVEHHLAKVRVASSNLVIRSKVIPDQRPFRGPLISFSVSPLYYFSLPLLSGYLAAGPENVLGGRAVGAKRAAVWVISAATADVSSAAPRLRPKGSGGIFFVRDGVWRVDIEVGRDKVTGRRRRVSRQVPGTCKDAEAALARLKVAAEQRRAPSGRTSARSVRAALDLYLEAADAGTIELAPRSVLTSRSAANTMCATVLLDGRTFGAMQLHKLTWREIEEMCGAMRSKYSAALAYASERQIPRYRAASSIVRSGRGSFSSLECRVREAIGFGRYTRSTKTTTPLVFCSGG
jgi:hypothetical protein